MKAMLEFNMPQDMYAFKCASVAQELAHAVSEVDRWYKKYTKRQTNNLSPEDVLVEMHNAVRELAWKLESE